jgi:hypothetical protein
LTELTIWGTARRLLLYVGIALAALAAFALIFALSIRTGIVIPGRWIGLVMWTAIVFGVVVRARRKYWTLPIFWLAVAGLLIIHLLAFALVLNTYPQWRPLWFIPVAIGEAAMLGAVLDTLFANSIE